MVKGFDIHIGKDVTPAAQSGSRRIAEFVCWGETDGVGLVSIRLVLLFKGDRLRGAKDYGINVFVTIKAITATKAQPC